MSRIVIAEDDPHTLRVISLWLARQGHEVREARSGATALELIAAGVPDVLITDVNMPGMDGLQLIERIVGTEREPRGIVVLTNRWDHGDIRDRLAGRGVHVIPKPFSPSRLSALVAELTAGTDAAAARAESAAGNAQNEE